MSKLSVVPLRKPASEAAVALLRDTADRFEAGEFTAVFLIAFKPDGGFISIERGEKLNGLEKIGVLEGMKWDVLEAMRVEA